MRIDLNTLGTYGLGLPSCWMLAMAIRRLRGTTLTAPLIWAAGSLGLLLLLAAYESFEGAGADVSGTRLIRYIVACSTLCPGMALLGAKRPQHRAWDFIVASLWIVLTIPAIQALVFSSEPQLDIHPAWRWFLFILITVQCTNHLPTRLWPSALAIFLGQLVLLAEFLPVAAGRVDAELRWIVAAMFLFFLASAYAYLRFAWRKPTARSLDRVWLDFRDAYGAVWGLRIRDRVNQLAEREQWPVRLEWNGFQPIDSGMAAIPWDQIEICLSGLLRRFVNSDWIAARLRQDET